MSTPTQTRNEPAPVSSNRSFKPRDAMSYKAWIAKAAKQPMVLETVDLGPLGAEDVEVAVEPLRFVSLRSLRLGVGPTVVSPAATWPNSLKATEFRPASDRRDF